MKKIVSLLLGLTVLLSCVLSASATVLYAPDGRTIEVEYPSVQTWRNVGWSTDPGVVKVQYSDSNVRNMVLDYLNLASSNHNSALKNSLNYLKYDNDMYLSYYKSYMATTEKYYQNAYNVCIQYTDLKPAADYINQILYNVRIINSGKVSVYNDTSYHRKMSEFDLALVEFFKQYL